MLSWCLSLNFRSIKSWFFVFFFFMFLYVKNVICVCVCVCLFIKTMTSSQYSWLFPAPGSFYLLLFKMSALQDLCVSQHSKDNSQMRQMNLKLCDEILHFCQDFIVSLNMKNNNLKIRYLYL